MRPAPILSLVLALAAPSLAPLALPSAIAAETPSPPNILLLCIDDLRPELACFGVDYIHSPNIDRLAAQGRTFLNHYVQAPTCGASRYALLTGRYGPAGNGAIFDRAKSARDGALPSPPSLPGWLRTHGYTTVSVGKVSHHPGGRGGPDWDDDALPEMPGEWHRHLMEPGAWQHPRGIMHGLAHGEIRVNPSQMDVFQAAPGGHEIYPDGLITDQGIAQLEALADAAKPFLLAIGIIRPHLPFGAPKEFLDLYADTTLPPTPHPEKPEGKTTWHGSSEFNRYNRWGKNPNQDADFALEVRRHYAACVSYADALVGRILARLDELGLADDTIVALWGDHGFHLGEHAIWGKHALFEESLRSPLIIRAPGLPHLGTPTSAIVQTVDIFPTLLDLASLPLPEDLSGRSLKPQLLDPSLPGHYAISYTGNASTIRTSTHRLIAHRDGHLELYDHTTPQAETLNRAADDPDTAHALLLQLREARP